MGTEISAEDLDNIQALAEQVVGFSDYRQQLASYLTARMTAIAPNLTALVGELVGARLIAYAGSLMNLSKSPASTLQILGAEKALFRALKTKHDTPKYGLIYHASLIGQATGKNKGKMARILAAKASSVSVWMLSLSGRRMSLKREKATLGTEARFNLERNWPVWKASLSSPEVSTLRPTAFLRNPRSSRSTKLAQYNADADALSGNEEPASKTKKEKKKVVEEESEDEDEDMEDSEDSDETEKLAAKAGLSVKRYLRKLERGEIQFDAEGNPTAISKKDLKKAKKEAKKAAKEKDDGKKRKRDDEDADDKAEKKKKKKKSKN